MKETTALQAFVGKKEFLVCVDSDGCAMDTMDIKHIRCFGPCMVAEWGLEAWQEPILTRWNEINLYTMTRGINRFKGLVIALTEIDRQYIPIEGLTELADWANHTGELSNSALEKMLPHAKGPALAKALAWSNQVNAASDALPKREKKPFIPAAEGLAAAHAAADVAVVSSANREAVEEEWSRCGLLESVDVLCCQDAGTKADCIAQLKAKGYAPDHILMVGDAPGDRDAARKNGVLFYPILVRHEADSWAQFTQKALPSLLDGSYPHRQAALEQRFADNLGAEK